MISVGYTEKQKIPIVPENWPPQCTGTDKEEANGQLMLNNNNSQC